MTDKPMELREQLKHLIDGCRHVREKRKGKHDGASAEAAYIAQEVTDQLLNLAIPLNYWERIATAQATAELDEATAVRIFTPLNGAVIRVLSRVLEETQPMLRPVAAQFAPLGSASQAPLVTGATLLRQIEMAGVPLAEWLRTASASRWMRSLIDTAKQAFADGWDLHREAVKNANQRAIDTITETSLWQLANQQLPLHWADTGLWRYTATLEKTCQICLPDHGKTAERWQDLPQPLRHPNCHCLLLPATP